MDEIKYYPVIDMSSDGKTGCAVFPAEDEAVIKAHHKAYLEEIVRGSFRLHTDGAKDIEIRCPRCGKPLRCVISVSGSHRCPVYRCEHCK